MMTDQLGSNLVDDTPRVQKAFKSKGMPETRRIILEENEAIPPTGLFLGINGRSYLLRPGEEVDVPMGIIEILNNATMSTPVVDPQSLQVLGYRERMRYPYRVVT